MEVLPGRELQGRSEWRRSARPDGRTESGHPEGPLARRCVTAQIPPQLQPNAPKKCQKLKNDPCESATAKTWLTVKGEVTEKGGQQVHHKHGQYGNIGNFLHSAFGGTKVKQIKNIYIFSTGKLLVFFYSIKRHFGLTLVAQCRSAEPLDGRQKQKPELGWCMLSTSRNTSLAEEHMLPSVKLGLTWRSFGPVSSWWML